MEKTNICVSSRVVYPILDFTRDDKSRIITYGDDKDKDKHISTIPTSRSLPRYTKKKKSIKKEE